VRALDPRLLRHAGATRRFIGLTAALAVVAAGLVMVQAQLLAGVIDRAFLSGAGLATLTPALAALTVVFAARGVLAWAGEVAAHRAAADVIRQLRTRLVAHALHLGPRRPDLPSSAELATLATRGLDGLEGYFSRYLPSLLVAAVVPAAVAGRIMFADWVAGLLVALTVPIIPMFGILVGLHTRRATSRQWRALAMLAHHFLDLVAGLDVLVAFGRARAQTARLRLLAERHRVATMRTLRVAFLSALVLELAATLSVALVAVSVGLRLVDGGLDLGTGLLVLVLAPEVYLPLRAVGARFHDAADGLASADRVFAVLEVPGSRADARTPVPDPARAPVRLHGVTVDGRAGPVLDALELTIPPGAVLGVRGASGAGKSTLLDLLLGFRVPDRGSVTVGGVDLADLDRGAWLRRVAWVPQRPMLLAGTVGANIRLADPAAGDERVRGAAASAALDVPLDTVVGDGGTGLSTGQQRRVALARALLADRPLLLLDEPTEGVDPAAESAIVAALPGIAAGRTVVLVSHRPEVLRVCDRVLELDERQPAGAVAASRGTDALPETAPWDAADPAALGDTSVPADEAGSASAGAAGGPAPFGGVGTLRRALRTARAQRWRLLGAVGLGTLALGCGVALTATSAWLIASAALHPPVLSLMVAIVAVRAFGLGKGVFRYAERLVSHDAALRACTELRVRIWGVLVRLGSAATARLRRGELLARLTSDVDEQQELLLRTLVPVGVAGGVGAATVAGISLLLPAGGLTVLVGFLAAAVVAPGLAAWAAWRSQRRTAAARGEVAGRTVEILEAAPDLLAFGAAERYRGELGAEDERLGRLVRRAATARGLGAGLAVLSIGATSVGATAVGIVALRAGALPGPALAVLALTPLALADVVAGLPEAATRLLSALPSAGRLARLEQRPTPAPEPAIAAGVVPPSSLATVALAVRWPDARRDAVSGVDLALPAGSRTTLTGPSGSGKSTVVAALLRGLLPHRGAVRADGRDTRELTGDEVRRGIAWCGSWSHLFDSTLRANLRLADPRATDEQIEAALRRARLGGWLAGLPDGLDTALGEHGRPVSGGERQRIGVARALLADRPILLLDEPTAHLDPDNADALAGELMADTRGRTALIVTHRPEQAPGLTRLRLGPAAPVPPPATAPRSSQHPDGSAQAVA
jgi:ATP-binding cassette subfamily C protein CydCD